MSSSDRRQSQAEEDIVDMKKAIATGSAKEGPSVSAGEYSVCSGEYIIGLDTAWYFLVAPILCYCVASILMTVVNKVRTTRFLSPGDRLKHSLSLSCPDDSST